MRAGYLRVFPAARLAGADEGLGSGEYGLDVFEGLIYLIDGLRVQRAVLVREVGGGR